MEIQIKRTLFFLLQFANTNKIIFLENLTQEYLKILNYFIDLGYENKKLLRYSDIKNLPFSTWLNTAYLNCILWQANKILKNIFSKIKKNKKVSKPEIKKLVIELDSRIYKFQKGNNSFDFWLLLRDPVNKKWIYFPVKNYEYAKEYFENYQLCTDIKILKKNDKWFLGLTFKKETELIEKEPKGIDIGYRKLITTSDGEIYGGEIKEIIEKRIIPKRQGSKNWKKAKHFLKCKINEILKKVIDGSFSPVIEDLKNLKKNKKGKWSKIVNRRFNYWTYSYILRKIKELCENTGVQYHIVPSLYTSRTCPICFYQDKLNRSNEKFKCLNCGYEDDVDIVAAKNILLRFTEELKVPLSAKLL